MHIHHMKLAAGPFNKIAAGTKVIESRLFDEKRQQIKIGDQIIFSEQGAPEHSVQTIVTNLFHYPTFMELFGRHEPSLFGGDSPDSLLAEIKQFYSDEDERAYGVIGIQVSVV